MSTSVFSVPESLCSSAWVDEAGYFRMYEAASRDPDAFWGEHGKRLHWIKPYTKVKNTSFTGDVKIRWFEDGTLNASANCIDRHLPMRADQTAILWEGDSPNEHRHVSYAELHENVCRLANVLKARGVKKGDRVTIYLPMIPRRPSPCSPARGSRHPFGGVRGFSPDSLMGRIQDCESTVLITADEGRRGGRKVPLKANADVALKQCPTVGTVIVVRHTGGGVEWTEGRDVWYHEALGAARATARPRR